MSCQLGSSLGSAQVPLESYNVLANALESERRARLSLEGQLSATRAELTALHVQLARMEACASCRTRPESGLSIAQVTEPAVHSRRPAKVEVDTVCSAIQKRQDITLLPREERGAEADDTTGSSKPAQDKEILSHCSDISAHRSDATLDKRRKGKLAVNGSSAVKKTSKTKKERPVKAKVPGQSRYWTPDEHKLFLEALNKYGYKDLRAISAYVGTRNMTQVRTHSQKYFMRLMREAKRQNPAGAAPSTQELQAQGSPALSGGSAVTQKEQSEQSGAQDGGTVQKAQDIEGDKYSVPNTCGMTLLCLVGQDTLTN